MPESEPDPPLVVNSPFIDLLEVFYFRVLGMGQFEDCNTNSHINKYEVLAMIEDAQLALKGQ